MVCRVVLFSCRMYFILNCVSISSLLSLFPARPGIAASVRPRSQTSPSSRKAQSPALYPALHGASELQDYSIISMPGTERQNSEGAKDKMVIPDDIHLLIPHATQLMSALKDGLKDMDQLIGEEEEEEEEEEGGNREGGEAGS